MDTTNLVSQVRARFKQQQAKLYLQEKYKAKLILVEQGGVWTITPEFIAFLRTSPKTTIILDDYDSPIKVKTQDLLNQAETTYNNIMTEWVEELEKLEN